MHANLEAAQSGVIVERIVILPDSLWPDDLTLPSAPIGPWLKEQHDHGLHLVLVRATFLAAEPDLLADFGIYGDRAVGTQELYEYCRTVRFMRTGKMDAEAGKATKDLREELRDTLLADDLPKAKELLPKVEVAYRKCRDSYHAGE